MIVGQSVTHTQQLKSGCDMTVRHILQQKGRNLWTIDPDATVFDALAKMAEKDVGSLVVMDREKLIGIITERHYSRNVIFKGKTSPTTLVREIWSKTLSMCGRPPVEYAWP